MSTSEKVSPGYGFERVVTVTPAPSIDRTYFVPRLAGGEHHRATSSAPVLAGKGVNLSRTLAAAGGLTRAVMPLAESDRLALVEDHDLAMSICVDVPWAARSNIIVAAHDGVTTNLNAEPHPLTVKEWEALTFAALRAVVEIEAGWLVIAGTFPLLADSDRLIDIVPLVRAAQALGVRIAVDSSGAGLRAVLEPTLHVDVIKPNRSELAELTGRRITTMADAVSAAQEVRNWGVAAVIVSLGADGALHVGEETLWAPAPSVPVANTTGAGDAMLAGFLGSAHADDVESVAVALRRGVAWGAAAVQDRMPESRVSDAGMPAVRSPLLHRALR